MIAYHCMNHKECRVVMFYLPHNVRVCRVLLDTEIQLMKFELSL